MLILILDTKTALAGAVDGIRLCLCTVVPSLFPFFVLSIALTKGLSQLPSKSFSVIGRLFSVAEGSEGILISGFLGGYPVGAQCISAAVEEGRLSHPQGRRMLMFCNQPGPAFLFGMVAAQFPAGYGWLIWMILLLSGLLVAKSIPDTPQHIPELPPASDCKNINVLSLSIRAMGNVCAWVILFRVLLFFLERWILWLLPLWARVLVSGFVELSNGCLMLSYIEDIGLRLLIAVEMLSFGGLCVTMQTFTAAPSFPRRLYLKGKLLQCSYAAALTAAMMLLLRSRSYLIISGGTAILISIITLFFPGKNKNLYGVSGTAGV